MPKRPVTHSVAEFAELLGVTPRRINQLIQVGLPHRRTPRGTRIVVREALEWQRERDRAAALDEDALSYARENARKLRAQSEIAEHRLASMRLNLFPTTEVVSFRDEFVSGFSAAVLNPSVSSTMRW